MDWRQQESLQSSKALAILELKDCAIEKLERELDEVQSKLAEIKNDMSQNAEDLQLQAVQAAQAAEFERRRGRCQDSAMKTRLAEERLEAAREQAEELRKDRDAVEAVAERLMQLRQAHLEANVANGAANESAEMRGQRLWDTLRSAMVEHKAQLSLIEVAAGVQSKGMEEKWMEERQCNEYREELRWLQDHYADVEAKQQRWEKRALDDLAKAESTIRDEQKEASKMRKELEEVLKKDQLRRRNEQALMEAEQDLDTLHSELQLAEAHETTGPVQLASCTSLVGRLGALAELEVSTTARVQVFQAALQNLEAKEAASWAPLLQEESLAKTLALQQSCEEQLGELQQQLQLKTLVKREEVEQAERQKALREELLELSADGGAVKEKLLPLPRLRPLLLRQLSQVSTSGSEDSDLQDLLDNLMKLLRELQQQFLEAQRSSEEWKFQVLAPEGNITPVPSTRAKTADLAEQRDVSTDQTELAKLEAKEAVLKSELVQQKKHFETLKERRLVEMAAFKVEAAKAELRGRQKFFQGNWRDVLTENVWTMVQRVSGLTASEGEVLRAAELLRIMGFRLCALEMGWMLQQRQVYGDLLQLAAMFSKQLGTPDAWQERFVQLAEAEQLRMDAVRLKAELQTMKAELHEEKSREKSLRAVDPPLEDGDMLMSTVNTMGMVMQMCFRLVSAESEEARVQSDLSTQILREVQDVGNCCQQLQRLVRQKEVLKSLPVTAPAVPENGDFELWPRKLEGLLGLQQDMQLEYKSAAEELLELRDSRSELAQALQAQRLQLEAGVVWSLV